MASREALVLNAVLIFELVSIFWFTWLGATFGLERGVLLGVLGSTLGCFLGEWVGALVFAVISLAIEWSRPTVLRGVDLGAFQTLDYYFPRDRTGAGPRERKVV